MIYFNVYSHLLKKFFLIGIDYPTEVKLDDLKLFVKDRIEHSVFDYFEYHNELFKEDTDYTECIKHGFIAVECMYYNPDTATCSFTPMTKESFFFEI